MTTTNGDNDTPPEGEVTPPAPEGAPAGEVPPPPEGEEDPLTTANPFKEGSDQHTAFERQREKFKVKLEKERDAARKDAEAQAGSKLDRILEALGTQKQETPAEPVPPPTDAATPEDVKIVSAALMKLGIDPNQIAQERQRAQVTKALADLRAKYPGSEFNDMELVKYANDTGISRLGGSPLDILELALIRSKPAALQPKAPVTTPPPVPKKEPVKISAANTRTDPAPQGEQPKTVRDWARKMKQKYAG